MKLITKDKSYFSKRNVFSIKGFKESIEKYSSHFSEEASLKTNTPIFLDTNVLIRYYSISFTAREKLFAFIEANAHRIVISSQVQSEFIKNRESAIQKFFDQVTSKIPKEFNSDVVNKMKSFIDQHKVVLKDYPFVEESINKHKDELEGLLKQLNETSEQKGKEHQDLIVKDKLLDLLTNCTLYESLTDDELKEIIKNFDFLSKEIPTDKADSFLNKSYAVFPGYGDIKEKPEYPYGDYIIFHEMMKYMLNENKDVLFLTFDTTKGDWMTKGKLPHLHFIQNMYSNTGKIIYILDAERTLETLLNVNIDSLVSPISVKEPNTSIIIEELQDLLDDHFEPLSVENGTVNNLILDEVILNGYNSLEEVKRSLDRATDLAFKYVRDGGHTFNSIGMLRACLRIINPYYKVFTRNGIVENLTTQTINKYKRYTAMLKF